MGDFFKEIILIIYCEYENNHEKLLEILYELDYLKFMPMPFLGCNTLIILPRVALHLPWAIMPEPPSGGKREQLINLNDFFIWFTLFS